MSQSERGNRTPTGKPKLPLNLGGTFMPNSDSPTTSIYSERLQPHHQSGRRIADDVPEDVADWIIMVCNNHDALVAALTDMLSGWQYTRSHHGDLYGVGWERCEQSAKAALAKIRGTP